MWPMKAISKSKKFKTQNNRLKSKCHRIVEAIHRYRAQANIVAAKYSGNVSDAMQKVLNAGMPGQSGRQFAQSHGLEMGQMFRGPNQENLQEQVKGILNSSHTTGGLPPDLNTRPPASTSPTGLNTPAPTAQGQQAPVAPGSPPRLMPGVNRPPAPPVSAAPATPAPATGPMPGAPSLSHGGTPSLGVPAGGGAQSVPPVTATPLTGAPTAPASPVQPVIPADLVHSFDKGMQAGTPISATAGAVPPPQPPEPQAPPTTPTSGMGSVPVNAPGRGMTMTRTRTICDACRAIAHHRRHHGNLCPRACYG